MTRKRDRLQVIHDILHAISEKNGRIKPTHILYKSNLSHQMMEEYISELRTKGFITENAGAQGRTYSITQKGLDYLAKYGLVVEFIDSFGLA